MNLISVLCYDLLVQSLVDRWRQGAGVELLFLLYTIFPATYGTGGKSKADPPTTPPHALLYRENKNK